MKKILIVEDDNTNAEILEFYISNYLTETNIDNTQIDIASNGYEAFGMHFDYQYNIIFLDLKMPKCDGLKFLDMLENINVNHYPYVIMVTGMDDEKLNYIYKQKGVKLSLFKPYDMDKIYTILEQLLNQEVEG
jgi:CheY-like chemotaxis protein